MEQLDGLLKADDGTALRFFYEPRKNNFWSEKLGRPIFDKALLVEVITPGSRESIPVFEVERTFCKESNIEPRRSNKYKQYLPQITAFLSGSEAPELRGTPLTSWPAIDTAMAATLRECKIYTVDALATLPDSQLNTLGPGALELRARAKAFLDAASGGAGNEALAAENERLKVELTNVQAQLAEMNQRLTQAEEATKRPPATPQGATAVEDAKPARGRAAAGAMPDIV